LLALALVGGDVSPLGLARYGGVSLLEAETALAKCHEEGLVDESGRVDPVTATALVAELPLETVAEVRAKAARHWMAGGPEHLLAALDQVRAAGTLLPLDDLVDLADRGGRMSLSLHDYRSAVELLKISVELDTAGDPTTMGRRLCDLAAAMDGIGDVVEARNLFSRAAALAEITGDGELMTRAAVGHALPVDWYAGDQRSTGLLSRAEAMSLNAEQQVLIAAARALVEMRIPVAGDPAHQVAWVTRPAVAHGLADTALAKSAGMSTEVRGLALLSWRATHRSPNNLAKRREISKESLDVAQLLRNPSYQLESAVWLAADALESADRPLYDEALSVARWVADRDGNPRLVWRAHTLSCGAAHLDGNLDDAERWRNLAHDVGRSISSPGWLAADLLLLGESVVSRNHPAEMERSLYPEDFPAFANPIGRAAGAYVHAAVGDPHTADRMVRRALRQLDPEASYLLLLTRSAAVVALTGNAEIAGELLDLLSPWSGHVAVDSNCWWCDGPVDGWLASLSLLLGDRQSAARHLRAAEPVAVAMNDARSLERLDGVRRVLGPLSDPTGHGGDTAQHGLSPRQIHILGRLAHGLTNREIAEELAFSVSTIRIETMAIYRILGVKSRAEAVARGNALALITPG